MPRSSCRENGWTSSCACSICGGGSYGFVVVMARRCHRARGRRGRPPRPARCRTGTVALPTRLARRRSVWTL